eukprot:6206858-Pleurochrysis_carterae.AAC.1
MGSQSANVAAPWSYRLSREYSLTLRVLERLICICAEASARQPPLCIFFIAVVFSELPDQIAPGK